MKVFILFNRVLIHSFLGVGATLAVAILNAVTARVTTTPILF
ncbi:hypothetical protein [Flectobacillus rivi]|uniref:Uncharacterized protein n=1 Tax=Flectobacillus rivi TaxID=2984209 RepID=A0ABT6YWA4_9BACT|nr:hypothetical protein [Flectobacillus rivi]MDI9873025.1 hypothetical protein [Flectobacillus rivi]